MYIHTHTHTATNQKPITNQCDPAFDPRKTPPTQSDILGGHLKVGSVRDNKKLIKFI